MLLPLGTDRPRSRPALVTPALVALNVLVFAAASVLNRTDPDGFEYRLGLVALDPQQIRWWNFITYAFVHADFWHILGNMIVLVVFGPNIEDRFSRLGFLAFYLVGAAGAGLTHVCFEFGPVIGASGAIAAVTGAYLVLFPRTHVKCLLFLFVIGVYMIPAWWFIAFAIMKDFLTTGAGLGGNVATLAHLGGYAVGIGVSMLLLWTHLLEPEGYDLFSIAKHANRRRQFRELAYAQQAAKGRAVPAQSDARTDALAEQRAKVSGCVSNQDMAGAAEQYARLVARFSDIPKATVMSRRTQMELANHLFAVGEHRRAADAYGLFALEYPDDSETPRVRVMLALLSLRYLSDPDAARKALEFPLETLVDPEQRELARSLAAELHSRTSAAGA